jgi:uncharacterized protein YndB with AHSA1/START domain
MSTAQADLAVRFQIAVHATIERAFATFTEGFDGWWPRSHKIGKADLARAVLEPRAGGRWYEIDVDGSECEWGRVLAWEPPHRVVLSWRVNGRFELETDPARASEIEVRFTAVGPKETRVDLEHRHIERHEAGAELAKGVSGAGGWPSILAGYASVLSPDRTPNATPPV